MDVTTTSNKTDVVLHVAGRLDSDTTPAFERDIAKYLASPSANIVIDFIDLDYISSAGLRVIMKASKAYRHVPFDFVICRMQDHIQEVFEISGFDKFVTIKDGLYE